MLSEFAHGRFSGGASCLLGCGIVQLFFCKQSRICELNLERGRPGVREGRLAASLRLPQQLCPLSVGTLSAPSELLVFVITRREELQKSPGVLLEKPDLP